MKNLEQYLLEVAEREKSATPGPWHVVDETEAHKYSISFWDIDSQGQECPRSDRSNNRRYTVSPEKNKSGWETDSGHHSYCLYERDAKFLAHAREDIPKLLTIIKKLKAESFQKNE